MSVAARVAEEMSVKLGNEVSVVYYHANTIFIYTLLLILDGAR